MKRATFLLCLLAIYASIFFILSPLVGQVMEKHASIPFWWTVLLTAMVITFALSFVVRAYAVLTANEANIRPRTVVVGLVLAAAMLGASYFVLRQG